MCSCCCSCIHYIKFNACSFKLRQLTLHQMFVMPLGIKYTLLLIHHAFLRQSEMHGLTHNQRKHVILLNVVITALWWYVTVLLAEQWERKKMDLIYRVNEEVKCKQWIIYWKKTNSWTCGANIFFKDNSLISCTS